MWAKIAGFFAGTWAKVAAYAAIIAAVFAAVISIRNSGKQAERLKSYETAHTKRTENLDIRKRPGTDQQLIDELRKGDF